MSYEGTEEFICPNGHYWSVDNAYLMYGTASERNEAVTCHVCKKKAQWTCSVDETNGEDPKFPWTMRGPKKVISEQPVLYAPDLDAREFLDNDDDRKRWREY